VFASPVTAPPIAPPAQNPPAPQRDNLTILLTSVPLIPGNLHISPARMSDTTCQGSPGTSGDAPSSVPPRMRPFWPCWQTTSLALANPCGLTLCRSEPGVDSGHPNTCSRKPDAYTKTSKLEHRLRALSATCTYAKRESPMRTCPPIVHSFSCEPCGASADTSSCLPPTSLPPQSRALR